MIVTMIYNQNGKVYCWDLMSMITYDTTMTIQVFLKGNIEFVPIFLLHLDNSVNWSVKNCLSVSVNTILNRRLLTFDFNTDKSSTLAYYDCRMPNTRGIILRLLHTEELANIVCELEYGKTQLKCVNFPVDFILNL